MQRKSEFLPDLEPQEKLDPAPLGAAAFVIACAVASGMTLAGITLGVLVDWWFFPGH